MFIRTFDCVLNYTTGYNYGEGIAAATVSNHLCSRITNDSRKQNIEPFSVITDRDEGSIKRRVNDNVFTFIPQSDISKKVCQIRVFQ